jgi:hypothetical protein
LRAAPDAVDAWRFESAVGGSGRLLAAGQAAPALGGLEEALARWRGPAYADFAAEVWARAEINRLDELRMLAVERRAEALLALGRAAEAAVDLRAHADDHPLREDAWQLLATALYRSGRQGEALAVLRRARQTLVAELGVDPGPGLRQLEAGILAQAPSLSPPEPASAVRDEPALSPPEPSPAVRDKPTLSPPEPAPAVRDDQRPFVGRGAELAVLEQAAETVARLGRPVLALVSGDAGAGKTALAEALAQRLTARGWTAEWVRSPEHEGAPVAWPWWPPADADTVAVDPAVARYRLRRAAVSQVAEMAGGGPVLLVADDLHRADEGTLDLLSALLAEPGRVLIVGTYRATEITPELTAALARFARTEPVRVYLGGLSEATTGELAGLVAGAAPDAPTARLIHRRSGGNPFFVRELARLLAAEGSAALEQVPAGVRDVIRHRLARLEDPARTVLRQAAVLGRDIDPDVLAALAGDEAAMLEALDAAVREGFVTDESDPPQFTHVLVRDTLYGDLSALRRARWHAVAAEAIERLHPDAVATLAHHFTRAAGRATAPRAAHYARLAAEQAERQVNPREAARWWQQAILGYDRAGGADVRMRLVAVTGLGRTLAVTDHLDHSRRYRAEAMATAVRLDDPGLTASVIASFDVPAIWVRNDDEHLSRQIVQAAERTLTVLGADRADHAEQRSRLLSSIALELRGSTTDRGDRAAREAEAIARRIGDPALLAFALNARFMHTFQRAGRAADRTRIGAELVDLAARHDLVTFEVLGRLILLQAHCALGEFDAADAQAQAADRLAGRYDLPLVSVFTGWYAALRLAVDGHPAEAEAGYRAADVRLAGSGMPGMHEGLLGLALLSLGRHGPDENWGPYEPWVRPLLLLSGGRRQEAAAALRSLPESPHDPLREARLCLAARAALALDDRATMAHLHDLLRPAAGELAGAGSGVVTFGPVGHCLAALEKHGPGTAVPVSRRSR